MWIVEQAINSNVPEKIGFSLVETI